MTIDTKENFQTFVQQSPGVLQGVDSNVIAHMVETSIFNNGNVVHLEYGNLKETLGEEKFYEFIATLGISRDKFAAGDGYSCVGHPGICLPSGHNYCDPQSCRQH